MAASSVSGNVPYQRLSSGLIRYTPRMRLAILVCLLAAALVSPSHSSADKVLMDEPSLFGRVVVYQKASGLVVLAFDGTHAQSAYNPQQPDDLVFEYVKVMAGAPAFVPAPKRVLLVGLGGGTLPSFWLRHFPEIAVDAVDIDPVVVKAAYQHFDMPRTERLRARVADGRKFIEQARSKWDVIVLDAYGPESVPAHLTTKEFLEAVKVRTNPGGVVMANLHSNSPAYSAMLRTYHAVFETVDIITPREQPLSRIVVAYPAKPSDPRDRVLKRLSKWTADFRLPFALGRIISEGWKPAPLDPKLRPLTDTSQDAKK